MKIRDTNIAAYLLALRDKQGKNVCQLVSTTYDPVSKVVSFVIVGESDAVLQKYIDEYYQAKLVSAKYEVGVNPNEVYKNRNMLLDIIFKRYGVKPKYFAKNYSIIEDGGRDGSGRDSN